MSVCARDRCPEGCLPGSPVSISSGQIHALSKPGFLSIPYKPKTCSTTKIKSNKEMKFASSQHGAGRGGARRAHCEEGLGVGWAFTVNQSTDWDSGRKDGTKA